MVYGKDGLLSLVVNGILGIVNAVVHSLIAHINGVPTFFLEIWLPDSSSLVGFARCGNSSCRAHSKGVLAVAHHSTMPCKSPFVSRCPWLTVAMLRVERLAVRQAPVIVDDNLFWLPVALTWSEDVGACILKHRYKEWHHYGLSEEVFRGTKEVWTLPFPESLFLVVVSSVARP